MVLQKLESCKFAFTKTYKQTNKTNKCDGLMKATEIPQRINRRKLEDRRWEGEA